MTGILASPAPSPLRSASRRARLWPLFASVVIGVPCSAIPAQSPARQAPIDTRVDRLFVEWDRPDSPGCAVAAQQNGRVVHARGYGSANLDYRVPLGTRSVFYLASVSKQFTAAAVVLAARQGHLSLDDDIRRWLPRIPDYGTPITVRHLVHHTSGLRDYLTLLSIAGARLDDVLTDAALIDLLARQKALNFAPGSEHLYSNTGYVLLAEIVARATGRPLRQFAEEEIFQPLGMHDTHFHDDAREVVPNRVIGYARDSSAFRLNHFFNFDKIGDGGLYSTLEDLLRWDRHFDEDRLGGGIVPQLLQRGVLANGDTLPYAFGLTHGAYRGVRTIAHGGSLAGFRTVLLRFPDERLSVIVLCNLSAINATALAQRVAEVYLEGRLRPATVAGGNRGGGPGAPPGTANGPRLDAASLREFAGTYESGELNAAYVLAVESDALMVRLANEQRVVLRPLGRDTFTGRPGTTFTFARSADGRPIAFTLDAGRVRGLVFDRKP